MTISNPGLQALILLLMVPVAASRGAGSSRIASYLVFVSRLLGGLWLLLGDFTSLGGCRRFRLGHHPTPSLQYLYLHC